MSFHANEAFHNQFSPEQPSIDFSLQDREVIFFSSLIDICDFCDGEFTSPLLSRFYTFFFFLRMFLLGHSIIFILKTSISIHNAQYTNRSFQKLTEKFLAWQRKMRDGDKTNKDGLVTLASLSIRTTDARRTRSNLPGPIRVRHRLVLPCA